MKNLKRVLAGILSAALILSSPGTALAAEYSEANVPVADEAQKTAEQTDEMEAADEAQETAEQTDEMEAAEEAQETVEPADESSEAAEPADEMETEEELQEAAGSADEMEAAEEAQETINPADEMDADEDVTEEALEIESTEAIPEESEDSELKSTLFESVAEDVNAVAEEDTVTRVEWLSGLTKAFEMSIEEENYPDNYFSDIDSSSEYYHDVMLATEFGLIDTEAGDPIYPELPASREFVAHTLNICMGYVLEDEVYTYSESGSVTYPDDIQIAVNEGWFTLDGKKFNPENAVTSAEKETLLELAAEMADSRKIDYSYDNQYELQSDVIVVPEGTEFELNDVNNLTIYDCPVTLAAGDKFAVISDGFPVVRKIKTVTVSDNQTIIDAEEVAVEDAFVSIDMQGSVEGDLTQVQAVTADVELFYVVGGTAEEYWQDGVQYESAEGLEESEISAVIVAQTYDISSEICKEFDLAEGTKAKINCAISNAKADYKFTGSKKYLQVGATVAVTCNVSMDVLDAIGVKKNIQLVRVPVGGIGYITATLNLALEGELTLNMVENVSMGVQYQNDSFKLTRSFKQESFTVQAMAKASAGVTLEAGVNAVVIKGDIYGKAGATATIQVDSYNDGKSPDVCTQVYAWMYASVGCDVTLDLLVYKKSWEKEMVIYDKSNSPLRLSYHYEDGNPVSACTRDAANVEAGEEPKYKYYTPADSQYGYNGASSGISSSGATYTIFDYEIVEDDTIKITGYHGNASALTIPSKLDGYTVVSIGSEAFKENKNIRYVGIPDTVTEIASCAFERCSNLASVNISDSVIEIGYKAFSECESLSSVTLSKNLEELGYEAFGECTSLTAIEIPKSLTEAGTYFGSVTDGPFYKCENLKTVTFEKGVTEVVSQLFAGCTGLEKITIPDTVTVIGYKAFANCTNLVNVSFSENLTQIGSEAFCDCKKIKTIAIPECVTEIGYKAFSGCESLSSVTLSKNLEELGYEAFGECTSLTAIEIPKSLTEAGTYFGSGTDGPFYKCDNLKTVTFEKGVTEVVGQLFAGCTGLEKITIPDTVTVIGYKAFANCTNLVNVSFSENLTQIGSEAFCDCKKIKTIAIPECVTEIGYKAFSGCESLSSVTLSKNLEKLEYEAFGECTSLTAIEIPKSLTEAGTYLGGGTDGPFYKCENLKTVTFEKGVTEVVGQLFAGCTGLEKITIPDTVTVIGYKAFANCTNLETVNFSKNLTQIDGNAFADCTSLETMEIPKPVTELGNKVFADCTSLKTVTIADSVTELGNEIFTGCTALKKVTLPSSIQSITEDMFYNCKKLTTVNFPSTLKYVRKNAFYDCEALAEVVLPSGVERIENSAFYGCAALEKVVIPDTTTYLGTNVFYECEALKDVTLGSSITSIPSKTFYGCVALQTIILPYQVATIDDSAFVNCTSFKEITVPRATTSIASNAFSYPKKMTMYGVADTYAETYADGKGIKFVAQDVAATSVSLNETEKTVDKKDKFQLIVSIAPQNFTDEVVWTSSDEAVATVSEKGYVTTKAGGTAKITVTVGKKSATCVVTVQQPVTSIKFDKSSVTLAAGGTTQLNVTVNPSDAANKEVTYTTSDKSVAKVSSTGKVTAVAEGTATITATAKDGSGKSATCKVTVTAAQKDTYTGLKSENGKWVYYENGEANSSKYGFIDYNGSKFLVAKGSVVSKSGLAQDPENRSDWYFLSKGQVQTKYTGLAQYDGAWFYVTKGKLDTKMAGYVEYDGGLFYVGAGRILTEANGLAQDPVTAKWYYLSCGQVQKQYTGLAQYDGAWFYIIEGELAENYIGNVSYDGSTFYVVNGKLVG